MSGVLVIVSAPSGTGKTTILQRAMQQVEHLTFSISHTTRRPRTGETDGRDYYFVDTGRFEEMIREEAFLEWARVHDNYYGTALAPLERQLVQGDDVILDIDVQGAAIIRKGKKMPAVHIFIAPPDLAELERRLRGRGTEDEETIVKRLHNARQEMAESDCYEYLVVNDDLDDAVAMLIGIIRAVRAKKRRNIKGLPIKLQTW